MEPMTHQRKTEFGVKLVTSKNIVGGKLDLTSAYFISESDAQNINKRSQVHIMMFYFQ